MGYFLGQIPFIHNNIETVLIALVGVSVIPMAIEFLRHRSKGGQAEAAVPDADQASEHTSA